MKRKAQFEISGKKYDVNLNMAVLEALEDELSIVEFVKSNDERKPKISHIVYIVQAALIGNKIEFEVEELLEDIVSDYTNSLIAAFDIVLPFLNAGPEKVSKKKLTPEQNQDS